MPLPGFEAANTLQVDEVVALLRTRIRLERRKLGISQAEFAAKCGIPLRTYKRLELGGCDSIEVLIRVTQGLGRAAGFESLFPAQPLRSRVAVALQSIKRKLDEDKATFPST